MKAYGYAEEQIYGVLLLFEDLRSFGVENVDRLQEVLFHSIANIEEYLDHWAEGEAALTLVCNDFRIVYEPSGKSGPDLSASCLGYRFYVEIARFREDYTTNQKLTQKLKEWNGTLVEYGRGEKDIKLLYGKILDEAKQLPRNERGLVFLRSDNVRIEDLEFSEATTDLDRLVSEQNLLARLSGVLLDTGWFNLRAGKRFYLWRNPKAERPFDDLLAEKLQSLREPPNHSKHKLSELRHRFTVP